MENIGANQNQRAAARRQLNKGLFAGRRVACAKSGSAFTTPDTYAYLYNVRSELTNATAEVDSAYRYGYAFDDIGNRETSSERGTNVPYADNHLNQDICGACPRQAWDFASEYPIFNLQSTVFRRSEPITKGLVP